jgi:cardiolipin synthase
MAGLLDGDGGVRIFEYGGPMLHAKTVVADGWWSKVGPTNLNFSSLAANWEVDLVAEDRRFGAMMEEMFEEDLDHAREVRLLGTGRYPRVRPERPIETADRRARRGVVGSGSGGTAVATRVGSVALQNSSAPINTYERALAAGASVTLLGTSLLAARFPRLVAWPLAATGGLLGGIGVLRTARSALSDGVLEPPVTDHHEPGER